MCVTLLLPSFFAISNVTNAPSIATRFARRSLPRSSPKGKKKTGLFDPPTVAKRERSKTTMVIDGYVVKKVNNYTVSESQYHYGELPSYEDEQDTPKQKKVKTKKVRTSKDEATITLPIPSTTVSNASNASNATAFRRCRRRNHRLKLRLRKRRKGRASKNTTRASRVTIARRPFSARPSSRATLIFSRSSSRRRRSRR